MGILYLVRHKSEVEGNGPDPTVGCYSISNPVIGIAAAIGDFWRPSAEDKQKNKKKKKKKTRGNGRRGDRCRRLIGPFACRGGLSRGIPRSLFSGTVDRVT